MLQKIFTTDGRLNRLAYLKITVGLTAASFLLNVIISFVIILLTGNPESVLINIFSLLVTLPLTVGGIMAGIRRLHDLNRSGWFMLATFVPVLNVVLMIYLLCFRGTDGYNQYGADPLAFEKRNF